MSAQVAGKSSSSRAPLWIILALCAAPVLASYFAYHFWRPSDHVNYGELLEPRPAPDGGLERLDGAPFRWQTLAGKWVLVVVDSGRCDAYCQNKLVHTRQVKRAQGKDADRVERVWIIGDATAPGASLIAAHPGLHVLHGGDRMAPFPAPMSPVDHVYVIDPLGNVMMRYPRNADPRRMLKDLARLLRHSKWR